MERFDKILRNEGMPFREGGFARTLFTCFSVIHDIGANFTTMTLTMDLV